MLISHCHVDAKELFDELSVICLKIRDLLGDQGIVEVLQSIGIILRVLLVFAYQIKELLIILEHQKSMQGHGVVRRKLVYLVWN